MRTGDWMQTYTGNQFWPVDPRPEEILIEDIAHSLSMLCRYGGHCLRFYSVAEHCVHVARAARPEHQMWALLHDAAEAYIVDVPRPLKASLPGYREAEDRVMRAVCERFGLPLEMPTEVKALDNGILQDEQAQNMAPCVTPWTVYGAPLGVKLAFWSPETAEAAFIGAFKMLTQQWAA